MAKTIVLDVEIDLDDNGAPGKVRTLNKELHDLGGSSRTATTGLGSLKTVIGALGVGYAITQIGQMAMALGRLGVDGALYSIKIADSFELMEKRLTAVRGSAQQAESDFAWITTFAQKTPATIDQVTNAFIKLTAYGMEPTDGTMQALTDVGFALGGSMEHVEGIITAVGQAWTKGKLQGEEALQMLERGVPVWDTLAEVFGITNAEVQELSTRGLLGREAIEALIAALHVDKLNAAADAMDTVTGKASNLGDQVLLAAKHIGEMAEPETKRALDAVAGILTSLDNSGAVDDLGKGLETMAGVLADLASEPGIIVFFDMLADSIGRTAAGLSQAYNASGQGGGIFGMMAGLGRGLSTGDPGRSQDPLSEIEAQIERMLEARRREEEKITAEQEAQEKALKAQEALQKKIAEQHLKKQLEAVEKIKAATVAQVAKLEDAMPGILSQARERERLEEEALQSIGDYNDYLDSIRPKVDLVGQAWAGVGDELLALGIAHAEALAPPPPDLYSNWVEGIGEIIDAGLSDVMFLAMTGRFGDIEDAFQGMIDSLSKHTADTLMQAIMNPGTMSGENMGRTALTGLGLAGVSYGAQTGGSMGILAGAAGGALSGYQIGAAAGPVAAAWGAVIGAVVGAAMSYFGSQSESPESDFTIGMGANGDLSSRLLTRGHQGVSPEENAAFVREQMAAYTQAETSYRDLLSQLGMDFGEMIHLPRFDTGGYTSASVAEIREYFRNEWLPEAMRVAFWEPLSEGLRGLGMDQSAVDALDRELSKLPGANQFDQLSMFITNVGALVETAGSMDWNAILDDTRATGMEQFLSGFETMRGDVGQAMAGLDTMSLLDQAELAGEINNMMLQARQAEIQMLRQIDATQNAINRSIGQQIEGLEMGGMTDQGRLSYVNQQIQTILSGLRAGEYTSPETLQQAMGELQRYTSMYGQLSGDNLYNESPFGGGSIADWLVSVLEEGRSLSDSAFDEMRDAVKEQNDALIAEMDRLIEAIMTFTDTVSGGGGRDGDWGGGGRPTGPTAPLNRDESFNVIIHNYITGGASVANQVMVEPTTAIS